MKLLILGIVLALQCGVSNAFSYTLELPEAELQVKAPGNITGSGKASFKGSLRYENDSGSFFFEDLNIDSLIVENVPPESIPKIQKMLEYVAKSSLKSIRVDSEILFVELGLF